MVKTVKVKDIIIGEGIPKICIPMVGKTMEELIKEANHIKTLSFDVIEWRVDFFEKVDDMEEVKVALTEIRNIIPNAPIIFTFRSAREGGERMFSVDNYIKLNSEIVKTGQVNLIDVELFNEEHIVKDLIKVAHENDVYVILSSHDFNKTPAKEEIVSRLRKAQKLGGDIPKIAVMPQTTADVITLLDATREMAEVYADRPIITMSMSGKGVISRLAGEVFGSALTFGAAKKASAPGQVPVQELREALTLLHRSL